MTSLEPPQYKALQHTSTATFNSAFLLIPADVSFEFTFLPEFRSLTTFTPLVSVSLIEDIVFQEGKLVGFNHFLFPRGGTNSLESLIIFEQSFSYTDGILGRDCFIECFETQFSAEGEVQFSTPEPEPVPEPLTLAGSATAFGFGILLKRRKRHQE